MKGVYNLTLHHSHYKTSTALFYKFTFASMFNCATFLGLQAIGIRLSRTVVPPKIRSQDECISCCLCQHRSQGISDHIQQNLNFWTEWECENMTDNI